MLEYVQRHIEKVWLYYRITERVITRFKVFIWEWTFRETLRVLRPFSSAAEQIHTNNL